MLSLQQVLEMVLGMVIKDKHLWEHSKRVWSDLLRGEKASCLGPGRGHQMAVALLHSALLPSSPAESGNAKSQESRLRLFIRIAYHFEALYTDCRTSVVFPVWSAVIHS